MTDAVRKVIRYYERGLYETVCEAVNSSYLTTDAERDMVREMLTAAE